MDRDIFIREWEELSEREDKINLSLKHLDIVGDFFKENTNRDLPKTDFSEKPEKELDLLILCLNLGDPTLAVVLHRYLNPKEIMVLVTKEARGCLKKLDSLRMIPDTRSVVWISNDNALDIYESLRQELNRLENRPEKIHIDVTLGNSLMSVALTKMAFTLKADISWVNSQVFKGVPIPWTSKLAYIEDPLIKFGKFEIAQMQDAFSSQLFERCVEYLKQLSKRIPQNIPMYHQITTRQTFCEMLSLWDQMKLAGAKGKCIKLTRDMKNLLGPKEFSMDDLLEKGNALDILNRLQSSKEKLDDLKIASDSELIRYLIAYLYETAQRRCDSSDYASGVLHLYRTMEMIEQRRFALRGISTENPVYHLLDSKNESNDWRKNWLNLKNEVLIQVSKNFKPSDDLEPPDKIALFDGYCILKALNDPVLNEVRLKDIQSQTTTRNRMIMEHGFNIVNEKQFKKFKQVVKTLLKNLFKVENWDLDTTLKTVAFPTELPEIK
ncbi:TIGR02710 family CRISPR-associated protein [bacterium]|nr:TIGR02710 family CRISPR-associated protein [bacterium]